MKQIVANKNFTLNGKYYETNDEVKVDNFEQVKMLNEKGFIKPLTRKELENFLKEKNKIKEEL